MDNKPEVVIEGPGVTYVTASLRVEEDEEVCRCGSKTCARMQAKRRKS